MRRFLSVFVLGAILLSTGLAFAVENQPTTGTSVTVHKKAKKVKKAKKAKKVQPAIPAEPAQKPA